MVNKFYLESNRKLSAKKIEAAHNVMLSKTAIFIAGLFPVISFSNLFCAKAHWIVSKKPESFEEYDFLKVSVIAFSKAK